MRGRARVLAFVAAAVLLAVAGIAAGLALRPGPPTARALAAGRRTVVASLLAEAGPDYVLLAGDSHAELVNPAWRFCGREVVNAGASGLTAADARDHLRALPPPRPPSLVVLTIGTNDVLAKKRPLDEAARAGFEAAARDLMAIVAPQGAPLVVAAVPPVGAALTDRIEARAIPPYSESLRALCAARAGCRFADPYAAWRDPGRPGVAREGTMRDGLHMASYRAVVAALEREVCP